nr:MAG TPA: hypothetical protein [Bacteriophage sp.]
MTRCIKKKKIKTRRYIYLRAYGITTPSNTSKTSKL